MSLPHDDVEFLDHYAAAQGLGSRAAALYRAVRLLRGAELAPTYEDAFVAWDESDEAAAWEAAVGDQLR